MQANLQARTESRNERPTAKQINTRATQQSTYQDKESEHTKGDGNRKETKRQNERLNEPKKEGETARQKYNTERTWEGTNAGV